MAKEYWYFVSGVLVVLLPLVLLMAVKKLNLLDARPDQKIVYAHNGTEELTLHAFLAKNLPDKNPSPALLLFHGGGWMYGGPEDMYPQCQYFSEQGFNCFSAQYRLGNYGHLDIRGAVADARDALDYLIDHAEELHIDPRHIVVGGGSSGGHLAAAIGSDLPLTSVGATAPRQRPAAQVLYNPILDFAPGTPYHHLVVDYWEDVSPHHHIDGETPPVLILVGSRDLEVPVPTVQAFCTRMRGLGGHCEIALYEGASHGFFNIPKYRDKTRQRILEFLTDLQH